MNKPNSSKTPEARTGEYLAGDDENVYAIYTVYANKAAAVRAAQAKWNKLQRGVAEFSLCLALGRADLYPETPVRVRGFKSVIDQQPWILTKVIHQLSDRGYTTSVNMEVSLSGMHEGAMEIGVNN